MNVYSALDAGAIVGERSRLAGQSRALWQAEAAQLRRRLLIGAGHLLDLGCGPGHTAQAIAREFPDWQITGLDADARILPESEGRCVFAHAPPGQALPLPSRSVDAVYGRFLMQHVGEPLALLAEARRVLRPGGRILLVDVDDRGVVFEPEPPALRAFYERAASRQSELGGDRHIGARLPRMLLEAGFTAPSYEVQPVTGAQLGVEPLLQLALGLKARILAEALPADLIAELAATPGFVACVPIFAVAAQRPPEHA